MPNIFTDYLKAMYNRPYTSSSAHRNAERLNVGVELVDTSINLLAPAAEIPIKLAQTCVSAFSIFRAELYPSERIIHVLQGSIAATQMGLAITLLFNGVSCVPDSNIALCKAIMLCQLLYRGTLLVGWVPSEFSKENVNTGTAPGATTETIVPQGMV